MFYVLIGGYDIYSGQVNIIGGLYSQLVVVIVLFCEVMIEIGEWNNVVVFIVFDFGCMVIDNGNGIDYGWGGYYFVVGGVVQGGCIYGDILFVDFNYNFDVGFG